MEKQHGPWKITEVTHYRRRSVFVVTRRAADGSAEHLCDEKGRAREFFVRARAEAAIKDYDAKNVKLLATAPPAAQD